MDFNKPPLCDGDCGRPAESDGRGRYKMVGSCNFWCGDEVCWHKIQEKIAVANAAYDAWRREQLATRRENEKFYAEHPEHHPDFEAEKEARSKIKGWE